MKEPISMERWKQAQAAERLQHTLSEDEGVLHYAKTYGNYFKYLKLGQDLSNLEVIEIGPADFPALYFCDNSVYGSVVEPMPSPILEQLCNSKGIAIIKEPFELLDDDTFNLQTRNWHLEIWLFNVMQHIIDPEHFIEKCKRIASRVRFFEPINYPTSEYHPHAYEYGDFMRWFPGCVNLYKGGSESGFHESDCAYGTYVK